MSREIPSGTPASSERPCDRQGDIVDFGGQRIGTGPCVDRDGRPIAHSAYVFPTRGNPVLRWSLAAAVVLALGMVGLYFVGAPVRPNRSGGALRTVLAPAPTIALHTLERLDCAQCHRQAHNVEDVRCERCHDPIITARLSNAAHVFQGTGDLRQALAAPTVKCATCHVEHRGAAGQLADVDDRECASCHRVERNAGRPLASLARHPEFAIVRAGIEVGTGLRWFNHETHLLEVAKKSTKDCFACHERAAGAPAFSSIVFARHCASCHEKDLDESAGSLGPSVLAALGPLPSSLQTRVNPDDPDRQLVVGIKHADPSLLKLVESLRMAADPTGAAAERVRLEREVVQLELMTKFAADPTRAGSWAGLASTALAVADSSRAGTPGSLDGPLRESAAAMESFAKTLLPLDPSAQGLADEAARLKPGTSAPDGGAPNAGAPAPTAIPQLRQLIDATIARAEAANNPALAMRAKVLQSRLNQLPPATGGPRLSRDVDDGYRALLRQLGAIADPGVRVEVRQIEYLAGIAQARAATGVDPTAFDLHRQQLLQLLEAVDSAARRPAGTPADPRLDTVRARASALRQRTLATFYGGSPNVTAARAQFFARRAIERVRVDSELDSAGLRLPTAASPAEDPAAAARRLDQLRRRLLPLGSARPAPSAITTDDARAAIAALLGRESSDAQENVRQKNRCTLCHELTPGRDQLAPVRLPGGSLLVNATFTHEHHVTGDTRDNCVKCHTGILTSQTARALNLPGVELCRTCHSPGQPAANATGCEVCHKYHAPPKWALMWRP